ncbi:MAG: response regulator transcription factor [Bacteroidia bacterium]|nr:response regulator transcription factor [Bacteroidia bacterium]MBP9689275.1 response regulator transcription factor [Bacteroidia bacterium]
MENAINALIIEDDSSSVALLKEFLKDFSYINILGEASNIKDAELLIKNTPKVDLVFMDIDLKGANGLDLIKFVNAKTKVLFITAFPDFAVKAFEYNTIDYIVKPISFDRLKKALSRLDVFEDAEEDNLEEKPTKNSTKFGIDNMVLMNIDNEMKFIKIKDINYIEAKGNYTFVSLNDGTSFTTYGLIKLWEDKLPQDDFFRVHRSTIVNLHNVLKIEKGTYDTGMLFLKGVDQPFEVSRNYFSVIKNKFKLTSTL